MPAIGRQHWTRAEVLRLIDEHPEPTPRYELVEGELLVTPSHNRTHQRLVLGLIVRVRDYVIDHKIGELTISPSDVALTRDSVLQPDVYVIPLVDGRRLPASELVTKLLLAIEVISPSSARYDRVVKRVFYQRAGVPEYWIVHPDAEVIERWRPEDERPEILDQRMTWTPIDGTPGLEIDIERLFAEARDEA